MPEVFGDSGSIRYAGYFQDEPNSEWRDTNRIDNVETMRRSDGTVKGLLRAMKSPLLAVDWYVEAVSDDPQEQEIKEFVEKNLFGMRRTWKEFLRECLTYFEFGFSVFEEIWEMRDGGEIWLVDLEPRIQSSIQRWKTSKNERGIVQLILTDEKTEHKAEIPIVKCLVMTNDKEGDDLTGQPVLRAAWKHFYIKDKLYRIGSIACERFGVGIPKITLPKGAGDAEKAAAKEMGQELRSNEKSVIVLPSEDWKVEIMTVAGGGKDSQIDNFIQHHDRMIVLSALAMFLNLGSDSTGSYALSKDQSSFFLQTENDHASYISEQITKQVIERLVILNYGKREKYPKLCHTPLGDIDFAEFSSALASLAGAQLINVDAKTRQFVHKSFGLPPITDEEVQEEEAKELDAELGDLENAGMEEADPMEAGEDGEAVDTDVESDLDNL